MFFIYFTCKKLFLINFNKNIFFSKNIIKNIFIKSIFSLMLKDIIAKIPSMHWSSSLKELAILLNVDT